MSDKKLRILVADSHYLIAMDLERMLLDSGQCTVKLCAVTALKSELQQSTYDVVMVNVVAPEARNLAHAEEIAATGARAVFLTTMDDLSATYPTLRGFPALQKPFDPDAVTALVRRYLDGEKNSAPTA